MANVILPNGARLYVDHAHPEYSSPEVTNPLDAVRWDKAGELVMLEATRRAADDAGRRTPRSTSTRTTPTTRARPTARTRTTCAAATPRSRRSSATSCRSSSPGRSSAAPAASGSGRTARTAGFQISQRADFFEVEVGLETTLKRPIVNTRDEPHADADRYRRLHVIIGDANMSEISTYLKVGTTALVLAMIEANFLADDLAVGAAGARAARRLARPVAAARASRSPTAARSPRSTCRASTSTGPASSSTTGMGDDADEQTRDVLDRWESVLARLADDPMLLAGELDWVAKLRLLEGYRDRDGLDWDSPRLQLVDLQYSDVRPEKGLYHRLVSRGRDADPAGPTAPRPPPSARRPRTPAPTSAASACAATARRSPRRRGTR